MTRKIDHEMLSVVKKMAHRTDLWPWYWLSCGDQHYCFRVVEAYVLNDADKFPKPGSELKLKIKDDRDAWIGENGVEMIIESTIAEIEEQNGNAICSFIAAAHRFHLEPFLIKEIPQ
jgi:hypothetical protein